MPKITAASIALTALALAVLTGCAGTPETAPSEPVVSGESVVEDVVEVEPTSGSDPTPTVEPVEPAPVTITPPAEVEVTPEDEFARVSVQFLATYGYEVTSEQMLAAGHYACDQLASGVDRSEIMALEGTTDFINGSFILDAEQFLCP